MLRTIALASVPLGFLAPLLPGSSTTIALAASSPRSVLLRGFATGGESLVVDLKNDKEFKDVIQKHQGLAIVDFTAKWCGPCRAIAPVYEQLSRDHPKVKFTKVDIDEAALNGTVSEHSISSVPTFVLYKAGKQVASFTGAQKEKLVSLIQQHA